VEFLIILLLVAILVWVYFVDKKTEKPQVLNIDVNVSLPEMGSNVSTTTNTTSKTENRKQKTTKEIPIEGSKPVNSWKNLEITDSFNG